MFRNRSHFGSRVAQAVCDLLILVIKLSMSEAWVELLRFSVATTFVSLGVLGTFLGGAGLGARRLLDLGGACGHRRLGHW